MARRLNPFLLRLSRWPRRIAALVCLLLAAASTLAPADGSPTRQHPPAGNPVAAALRDGQVAVPVTVTSSRAAAIVHPGDHVGVLAGPDETDRAGPDLVADGLRVLAASQGGEAMSTDAPVIVVAADRTQAVRLAAVASRPLLVVVDKSP
jgi:hypothetical protein